MANRLSEQSVQVPVITPADHQSAGIDGVSFHVGRVHAFQITTMFGALTGDSIMSLYSGATDGTKTTQESFRWRFSDADIGGSNCDQYSDWATVAAGAGLTLTAATYNARTVLIDMDSDQFTDGQPWITLEIDSTASTLFVSSSASAKPRFAANDPLTIVG